jgi:hypothetical protein
VIITTAIANVDAELTRLTGALASGVELPSVITAIRERETKRTGLTRELETLDGRQTIAGLDPRIVWVGSEAAPGVIAELSEFPQAVAPQFARVGTSWTGGCGRSMRFGGRREPQGLQAGNAWRLADRRGGWPRAGRCLRGVSGNAFELCPERLFRVPHVKRLLHPEPQSRSVTGRPLPEPDGHLWRHWRPTRQDSVQELS